MENGVDIRVAGFQECHNSIGAADCDRPTQRDGPIHTSRIPQYGFNLTQFYAGTMDLDLMIDTSSVQMPSMKIVVGLPACALSTAFWILAFGWPHLTVFVFCAWADPARRLIPAANEIAIKVPVLIITVSSIQSL